MKIEPVYVTFEQAKLLFEKGFPGATEDDAVYTIHDKTRVYPLKYIKEGLFYHAPEQHIVVEWLRVNHGIDIFIVPTNRCIPFDNYKFNVYKNKELRQLSLLDFKTPQEATSAVIDYILKELI
jgi:hypothetical protein